MPFIALDVVFMLAAWRWGDWRHWQRYHATILYFLLGDVLYMVLTRNRLLWQHQPWPPISTYIGVELCCFVCFACTTLIYLGRFPKGVGKSIAWIACWVAVYSCIEVIYLFCGAIKHFNGWTMLDSVLFNMTMFPMLLLHCYRPLLTYAISIPLAVAIVIVFKVPIK
ncbi:CBO0543 family protein [Paenibacillus glycinis]|uniref:Uncharacterized protein n=1 Tax=Paenibacillus glycinis TaxID=2697035 RepID=A0ABW9XQM3_9BACL|nr:CBO0543 family protein [Paenibacillus glycinis]NBD24939.1 hypothetical protein [Paenibacillus glycinis]